MATYRYRAATAGGQLKTGVLEGSSRADAIERVKRLGLMPIETVETQAKAGSADAPAIRLNAATRRGIVNAIGELAVLLNAGLPLDRALAVVVENITRPPVKAAFAKLRDRVRHGASLARAMTESNGAFSPMAAAMAEAGEASGKLDESLSRLGETMERAETLRQTITSSMVYPVMLMVIATSVILVMLLFVVPQFEDLFSDAGAKLPFMTQIVMAASHGVKNYGLIGLGFVAVALFMLYRWVRQPAVRRIVDRQLLKAPVIGSIIRNAETARFARTLGSLLDGGVPLAAALQIAQRSLSNMHMHDAVEKVSTGLRQGGGLSTPLAQTGLFPPMALSFLRTGEETAQLGKMLTRLADVLDRDVRNAIQRLIAVMTPVITVAMGAIVASVIASIMSAILGFKRFGGRTMTLNIKTIEKRRSEGGFTLLELLVVLAIMGMLAAIIAPQVIKYLGTSRTQTAKVQINNVVSALELFRLDVGRYPSQQEGLQSLVTSPPTAPNWNGPYLKKESALKDPWGVPYQYQNPGQHGEIDVFTLGQDNAPGGTGEAQMSEAGRRSSGFTLLETLVVVAITALIAGLVVPNLSRSLQILDLQQTTRLLQADLRVARATAMRTGQKVDLSASNGGHEYDWIGGTRYLPAGITLSMSGPLVVYPDGSVKTASITMATRRRAYAIAVDPVNGSVTVGFAVSVDAAPLLVIPGRALRSSARGRGPRFGRPTALEIGARFFSGLRRAIDAHTWLPFPRIARGRAILAGDDNGESGSVLVEAMVGSAIIAITLLGMYEAIVTSSAHNRMAEERRNAYLIAQSELAAVGTAIPPPRPAPPRARRAISIGASTSRPTASSRSSPSSARCRTRRAISASSPSPWPTGTGSRWRRSTR